MKRIIGLCLSFFILLCLLTACFEKQAEEKETETFGKVIYVSAEGSDSNEGTKEAPLASFCGAVAKVREYKTANGLPDGGIKVEFASGTYKISEQTVLTAEDSGEAGKPILYEAAKDAEVIFDGGVSLNPADFKPVNDDFKVNLLSDDAKNSVLEIDLISAGVGHLEQYHPPVLNWSTFPDCIWTNILYVNNEPQNVARWPNGTYCSSVITKEWDGSNTFLSVPEEKAILWAEYDNIHAFGFANYSYDPFYSDSVCTDPESSSVGIAAKYTYQENEKTKSFYLYNIPCELDEPGEYYIDTETDMLYYWPSDDFESSKISVSIMSELFVKLEGCDYISFNGLVFENLRYAAITGTGSDISISDCVFRCIANAAIDLTGDRHTIINNIFSHIGYNGIMLTGGDMDKKQDADSVIINNSIHDFGEIHVSPMAGISVTGCGFTISHNEIYNSPHEAIVIISADTIVEYNEIYNVCTEVADSGAIYSGCRYNSGSTVYRYNYIHDIVGRNGRKAGSAIYIDDTESFRTVYSNIIVNIHGNGLSLSGGKRLTLYNNILVNTAGISLDCRGANWYPTYTSYPGGIWTTIENADIFNSVWKYAQPEVLLILEMRTTEELVSLRGVVADILDSPAPPSYVDIYSNIGFSNAVSAISERSNLIFNRNRYIALNGDEYNHSPTSPQICDAAYWFGSIHDNLDYSYESSADIFVDPDNGNFFLKEDSRVYREIVGFEKWDYSLIGIQK